MGTVPFLYGKRTIFLRVKGSERLRGGEDIYAAPFRRTAEWDSLCMPEGRGPGMARVTNKRAG